MAVCDYGSCTTKETPRLQRVDYTSTYIPYDFSKRRTKGFDLLLAVVTALDCISGRALCRKDFSLRELNENILLVKNEDLKTLLQQLWERRDCA